MQNESFISENQRNHVAVTISDQSQVIFFINNGSPGGEKIPISQPSGILSYYVGVSPDLSPQSFFNGQIDEIMVWNNLWGFLWKFNTKNFIFNHRKKT